VPSDYLTQTEAFNEFGFWPSHLEKMRKSKHLVLGRKIKTKPAGDGHGILYWRTDLQRIKDAMNNPPGARFTDPAGVAWVSRQIATGPLYGFSFQRLTRWHLDKKRGCPFLSVDQVVNVSAQQLVVYKRRGFQKVWYFREDQLAEIRGNLAAGKVVSKTHGPGMTKEEAGLRYGFSRHLLEHWSDREGNGVWELGGRRLDTWQEARVSPHGHITKYRVYPPAQLKEIYDRYGQAPDLEDQRPGLSDREAMRLYQDFIREGDLPTWRDYCQWIGRRLHAWKVPSKWGDPENGGEWRNDPEDIEEIVRRMKEAAKGRAWRHPQTGKTYLPLKEFSALTGMSAHEVSYYREHDYRALGRPILSEMVAIPARRNSHQQNYVYLKEDGERIRDWRKARPGLADQAAKALKGILADGPVEANEVKRRASGQGISEYWLLQAREALGVRSKKAGGFHGSWYWHLPGQSLPAITAPADDLVATGAESRTAPTDSRPAPLPQTAYPVYIVQPADCPVPVTCVEARDSDKQRGSGGQPRPAVRLGAPGEYVHVRGKEKPPLPHVAYQVIKALLEAWPSKLRFNALAKKSGCSVPHKVLKTLASQDADWGSAIHLPGRGHRGGYGVLDW
jgi:hypothetical protein